MASLVRQTVERNKIPTPTDNRRIYLDFVSIEHRLIIELDGGQHSEQIEYDERPDGILNAQGYRVLRFWNNEVLQQTEAVLEKIIEMCGGK